MKTKEDSSLIELRDHASRVAREPLLIAHRGGVVTADSPENSLAAIRLAGKQAYDLVELDVVEAQDSVPVLFHGPRGHLGRDCAVDVFVHDLTGAELEQICYRASDQPITTLEKALALCRDLNLGVMLDIKNYGRQYSESFFVRIAELLRVYKLENAALTFSQDPLTYQYLDDVLLQALAEDEMYWEAVSRRESLAGRWWFGLPEQLSPRLLAALQERGALVIAAINRFRYPSHAHAALAGKDIWRLVEMGVNGLQLDSIYYEFLQRV